MRVTNDPLGGVPAPAFQGAATPRVTRTAPAAV